MQKKVSQIVSTRLLMLLLLTVVVSGCGAPASEQPTSSAVTAAASRSARPSPTAAASAMASAESSASPTPSTAATAEPDLSDAVLPAPLLFMQEGQIVRLERDGKTVSTITDEEPGQPDILAIIDFDVSPMDGSLVYVVQASNGNTLVRTDAEGKQRTVLLPNANVNTPRWSPDGTQIAVNLYASPEQNSGLVGGVYLISADGGMPTLLQANDRTDPANPSPEARAYSPHAWSPDGTRLLLSAFSMSVEVCSAAVKEIASGALVPINAPERMVSGCASGQWSSDGEVIYTAMAGPGPQPPVPGLWQADPITGEVKPFVQGEQGDGRLALFSNYRPLDDGSIYTFMSLVETLPEPFSGTFPRYKLYQGWPNDAVLLREEEFMVSGQGLWARDNSGIVLDIVKPEINDVITAWIPVDGSPVVELGKFMGEAKRWAHD